MFAPPAPGTVQPPSAPRPVPASAVGFAPFFMVLFGGIWGFIGVLLTVVFVLVGGPPWDDAILDQRGVRTVAVPVRSEVTSTRINRSWVYRVTYSTRDAAGVAREGVVRTVGDRTGPFEIEYDPENPSLVRPVNGSASVFGLAGLIPSAFGLLGTLIAAAGLVFRSRRRALYRDGTAVQARVLGSEPTGVRINRQRLHRVTFSFASPTGEVTASSLSRAPIPAGATVWALYDPAHPEKALLA